jgi:hypothetical protein
MKTLGMKVDQYEMLSTQAADQQITVTRTRNLSTAQMEQLCGQVHNFSDQAAMGSLVKPRVTMVIADLQKYIHLTTK